MDTDKYTNRQTEQEIHYSMRDSRSAGHIALWVVLSQDLRSMNVCFAIKMFKFFLCRLVTTNIHTLCVSPMTPKCNKTVY